MDGTKGLLNSSSRNRTWRAGVPELIAVALFSTLHFKGRGGAKLSLFHVWKSKATAVIFSALELFAGRKSSCSCEFPADNSAVVDRLSRWRAPWMKFNRRMNLSVLRKSR